MFLNHRNHACFIEKCISSFFLIFYHTAKVHVFLQQTKVIAG